MAEIMRMLGIVPPPEPDPQPVVAVDPTGLEAGEGGGDEPDEGEGGGGIPGDGAEGEAISPEEVLRNSVGYKMLLKKGWKEGEGLGMRRDGILVPVVANSEFVYGSKGAGLRHVSELLRGQKDKRRPEQMESWERDEKTEDWFKGSKSKLWIPAGLLEDQDKNFASSKNAKTAPHIATYMDAWDDTQVSLLVDHSRDEKDADADWEDQYEKSLGRDLEGETLNTELFFSCLAVLGSRVRLVQMEPTGEVFQHTLWAHDARSLRAALEEKLQSGIRVLRPLLRGSGDQQRCIYGVLSRAGEGQMNREAGRLQGLTLYGPMWLVSRGAGKYVRDYELMDYVRDFVTKR